MPTLTPALELTPDLMKSVERRRAYEQGVALRAGALTGIPAGGYLVWLLWAMVPHGWLLGWWGGLCLSNVALFTFNLLWLRRHVAGDPAAPGWLYGLALMSGLLGLAWGAIAAWIRPADTLLPIAIVLVAVFTVSLVMLMHYRRAMLTFTLAMWLVPQVVLASSDHTAMHRLQAGVVVLVAVLVGMLLAVSAQIRRGLADQVRAESLSVELRHAMRRLETLADHDELTGLRNRRAGLRKAHQVLADVGPMAGYLLVDVGYFKRINDTYGHMAGDQVLADVAQGLRGAVRPADTVARFGGEEFLVIIAGGQAEMAAERLRARVADTPIFWQGQALKVTVSIGCALAHEGQPLDAVLALADQRLYEAKRAGRNRVIGPSNAQAPQDVVA